LFTVIPISRCPEFSDVGKGVITQVLVVGDKEVLHIECEPGHDLMGPPKILCVDGHWEHVQKPQCSKRKSISSGQIACRKKDVLYKFTVY
jgi:hypothetical protein